MSDRGALPPTRFLAATSSNASGRPSPSTSGELLRRSSASHNRLHQQPGSQQSPSSRTSNSFFVDDDEASAISPRSSSSNVVSSPGLLSSNFSASFHSHSPSISSTPAGSLPSDYYNDPVFRQTYDMLQARALSRSAEIRTSLRASPVMSLSARQDAPRYDHQAHLRGSDFSYSRDHGKPHESFNPADLMMRESIQASNVRLNPSSSSSASLISASGPLPIECWPHVCRDHRQCQERPVCQFHVPERGSSHDLFGIHPSISQELLKLILSGKYVDLNLLLPSAFSQSSSLTTTDMSGARQIDEKSAPADMCGEPTGFRDWLLAFTNYIDILSQYYPSLYVLSTGFQYLRFVTHLHTECRYKWIDLVECDIRTRQTYSFFSNRWLQVDWFILLGNAEREPLPHQPDSEPHTLPASDYHPPASPMPSGPHPSQPSTGSLSPAQAAEAPAAAFSPARQSPDSGSSSSLRSRSRQRMPSPTTDLSSSSSSTANLPSQVPAQSRSPDLDSTNSSRSRSRQRTSSSSPNRLSSSSSTTNLPSSSSSTNLLCQPPTRHRSPDHDSSSPARPRSRSKSCQRTSISTSNLPSQPPTRRQEPDSGSSSSSRPRSRQRLSGFNTNLPVYVCHRFERGYCPLIVGNEPCRRKHICNRCSHTWPSAVSSCLCRTSSSNSSSKSRRA